MGAMVLDDNSLDTVLSFVRDAPARGCCKKWASHIYKAMMLESKIRVHKRISKSGSKSFDYIATRDLGPEITETVAFHIEFYPKNEYHLQFCHNVGLDLADDCVDMDGKWIVEMGEIFCETASMPTVNLDGAVVGRTKTPVRFSLPIELLLAGRADYASFPLRWEQSIRSRSLLLDSSPQHATKVLELPAEEEEEDEDAVYVEIDGQRTQVPCDIRANCPEESWANLTSIRIRCGF
jgi:hypothetical protein